MTPTSIRTRLFSRALVAAVFFGVVPVVAQPLVPEGGEFAVNTYIIGFQRAAEAASDPSGAFVVVWQSRYVDGDGYGIRARRFYADGTPTGDEFAVNTLTAGQQALPQIAMRPTGEFVVVWQSGDAYQPGPDGSGYAIRGQRFNADGTALGSELTLNASILGSQRAPSVAMLAGGDFVVAWHSPYLDGDGNGIRARRFDAAGNGLGEEFTVNTHTATEQTSAAVAASPGGGFVVVWQSGSTTVPGPDGNGFGIRGRRFDAAGNGLGAEFAVNTYITGQQIIPRVASGPQGEFVVTWHSGIDPFQPGPDGSGFAPRARRFDAAGNGLGAEFAVNTFTLNGQYSPVPVFDPLGGFVVVWESDGPDGSSFGIRGRRFDAAGMAVGNEFGINTITAEDQNMAAVTADSRGRFLVIWESGDRTGAVPGPDGSRTAIRGQRLADPEILFVDGFESGDTVAWSSSSP